MSSAAPTRAAHEQLLQPQVLAGLANLELIARAAVQGFLIGLHRSPQFGFSQEFVEYRPYAPGDDPRFIDWNVYARTDRAYIKRYQGETNSHLMLLLDASASMGFGADSLSKFRYAQILAASLAHLASRQHDAVGLIGFDRSVRIYRAPSARGGQLQSILHAIDGMTPLSGTEFSHPIERLREHSGRRGLVAMMSDFYCEPEQVLQLVRPLAFQGQDIVLFQILDRSELNPRVNDATVFEDMETGRLVEVSPDYVHRVYPARVREHIARIHEAATAIGADHVLLDTSTSLSLPLRNYLLFRERRR